MPAKPLKVLLISADRGLLREVGGFLRKFGYDVAQCVEPSRASIVLLGNRPDFMILDWDITTPECAEICRAAGGDRRREYVFTFLLTDDSRQGSLAEAISAGVDDFLARPVVYGELLARLRAGARVLEYERRVRAQATLDPLTGLLSRPGLVAKALTLAGGPWACVLMRIDDLWSIRKTMGQTAADELIEAMAGWLDQWKEPREALAHFGRGTFAVLLHTDEAAAAAWADRISQAAREVDFPCGGAAVRLTLSLGVAGGDDSPNDNSAKFDKLLEHAGAALALAEQSGQDGVMTHRESVEHEALWSRLAQSGQLFETTLARHVMTPSTLTLRPEEPLSKAAGLFRQTGLQAIAVVDDSRGLQGIVARRVLGWGADELASGKTVADAMSFSVTRFDESTPLATLMEHFLGTDDPLAVIVQGDAPTGLVSRRNLRTLIEPLSSESFTPRSPFVATSDYLLVPELCPAAGF